MTLDKFYKELGKLIEQGCGRMLVSVDKSSFSHALEGDGAVILQVDGVEWKPIIQIDDDGGHKINSKGRECFKKTVVIYGADREPTQEIDHEVPQETRRD